MISDEERAIFTRELNLMYDEYERSNDESIKQQIKNDIVCLLKVVNHSDESL